MIFIEGPRGISPFPSGLGVARPRSEPRLLCCSGRVPPASARRIATVEAIRSQGSTERVALVRVAGLVAGREPALTLLRRAMRPGLGVRCSLDRLLDPVIPDRRGGIERTRDIGLADLGQEAG